MSADPNNTKGRLIGFLIRNDADTEWELLGGVKTRGLTIDRPVEDTTSSSTIGDYNESEPIGFSQGTINVSGMADSRAGESDPSTGFNIVGYDRISDLATRQDPCARIMLVNSKTGGTAEGFFNITNWNPSAETQALEAFELTLQIRNGFVQTGGGI